METMTTKDEQGYNGWKNYETWVMALWIDNDQGSYAYRNELVEQVREEHKSRTGWGATEAGSLSHFLKEWQEELMPEMEASVWLDLLGAAFESIDWYEIAENFLSE